MISQERQKQLRSLLQTLAVELIRFTQRCFDASIVRFRKRRR